MKNSNLMQLRIVLFLALLVFNFGFGTSTVYAAAPIHDDRANAKVISGLTYQDIVDTTDAVVNDLTDPDLVGPCAGETRLLNAGHMSVWYQYTPPVDQSIQADTIGSTKVSSPSEQWDTYVVVWKLENDDSLTLVACNDDYLGGITSRVNFLGLQGITYLIEVAQFNGYDHADYSPAIPGNLKFNVNITNTDVWIGTNLMSSFFIPAGGQESPSYPNTFNGPVHVKGTAGQNVIASERQIFGNSFTETLGVPNNQLTTEYWFSWYDGQYMSTWVSIGAPTTNTLDATVDVYIGNTKMNSTPYVISPGGQASPSFPGTFNGPVRVVSTNGQNIIVSERQIFGSSFSETLGVPNNQLTTEYWFSWYDGQYMSTWVSIGVP